MGVEIVENRPVFSVNAAVGLVHDNEVEVPHGEQLPARLVPRVVDAPHHGLVGGEHRPGGEILPVLAEVGEAQIRQQVHKGPLGLGHQAGPVRQKQHVLHPAPALQHLHQGDDGPGLAGAGGHNQQGLAPVLPVKGPADGPYRLNLVVPPGDVLPRSGVLQRGPDGQLVELLLQIPLGIDPRHRALVVVGGVPDAGVEAVGEEDHRAASEGRLQPVGVQLGLLAARRRVLAGALGLHQSQRTAVVPQKDIVHRAPSGGVGHPLHRVLVHPVHALRPASILEHGVDIQPPGLVLGEIQGPGDVDGLLLLPPPGQPLPQGRRGLAVHDGLFQQRLRRPALRGVRGLRRWQQGRVKVPGLVVLVVTAGDKIQEIKKILQSQAHLVPGDFLPAVGGGVAQMAQKVQPPQKVPVVHQIHELRRAEQNGQLAPVGPHQLPVAGVHPLHRQLQRPPAAQSADGGIDGVEPLRRQSGGGEGCKLGGLVGGEVVHGSHLILYRFVFLSPREVSILVPISTLDPHKYHAFTTHLP